MHSNFFQYLTYKECKKNAPRKYKKCIKCTQKLRKSWHTKNAKYDTSGITDILPGLSPYWLSPITSFIILVITDIIAIFWYRLHTLGSGHGAIPEWLLTERCESLGPQTICLCPQNSIVLPEDHRANILSTADSLRSWNGNPRFVGLFVFSELNRFRV